MTTLALRLFVLALIFCAGVVLAGITLGRGSDGWTVAYITSPRWHITLMDTRTRLPLTLLRGVDFSEPPTRSPDGRYVAGRTAYGQITIFDLHTGDALELDDGYLPTWAPESDRIIYRKSNRLYIAPINGTTTPTPQEVSISALVDLELERTFGRIDAIAWSPDGGRIAVEGYYNFGGETVDYEVYSMRPDGSQVVNVSNDATVNDRGVTWSPEGDQLAFISMRDGNPEVYLADFARGDLSRLTTNTGYESMPVWSPDGRWLAFVSYRETTVPGLYLLDMNTGETVNEALGTGLRESGLLWSPDSAEIAYLAVDDGQLGLYVVAITGDSAPVRVVDLSGERGVYLLP